jgi:ParB family chromosome partitioning protein
MSKSENQPRKALGRGVSSLLPTRPTAPPPAPPVEATKTEIPYTVPIDDIGPNPLQPRRVFEQDKLQELAQSITHNGIVQPLVVRRVDGRYQLIAGERRLRAAKLAGLKEVPVVVRDVPDKQLLEITLIENIQREDLNPIETALAFQGLGNDLSMSLEDISRHTGKDRTTIVNLMRLLQLPKEIQQLLAEHKISAGHARALIGIPAAQELAQKIMAYGWSVRQVERVVQKMRDRDQAEPIPEPKPDANVRAAIQELERALGTRVRIVEKARKGGRIEIEYYSTDDLHRIYAAIVGEP